MNGRQAKANRRAARSVQSQTACLSVLAVGKGDMKMTWSPGDEEKAAEVIGRMLREGYGIFVETDTGLRRVKKFNAKRMTYVITDVPSEQATAPPRSAKPERHVPLAGSRARAVGATAGG